MARSTIAELALGRKLVSSDQYEQARMRSRGPGDQAIGQALVDLGFLSHEDFVGLLCEELSLPRANLQDIEVDPQVPHLLAEDFLRRHNIFPFKLEDDTLYIAIFPPVDPTVLDEIELTTGYGVEASVATADEIQLLLNQNFSARHRTRQTIVDMHVEDYSPVKGESLVIDEIMDTVDSPPVVRLVVDIIDGAINERASDIHLEPQENNMRVRYRI
ncbi:MAG: hypothetical protein WCX65_18420, partial [bacterium]